MSTDHEQSTTTLTYPSDALETTLESLPADLLSNEQESFARECCAILDDHHYGSGCAPSGLAASSIYLAVLVVSEPTLYGGHSTKLSQKQVGEYCGVSQTTVRKHYRKILELHREHSDDDSEESTAHSSTGHNGGNR